MDAAASELQDELIASNQEWTEIRRELDRLRRESRSPRISALERETKAQHMRIRTALQELLDANPIIES